MRKFIQNLSLKYKILLVSGIVFLLMAFVSIFALSGIITIASKYSNYFSTSDLRYETISMSISDAKEMHQNIADMIIYSEVTNENNKIDELFDNANMNKDNLLLYIEDLRTNLSNDKVTSVSDKNIMLEHIDIIENIIVNDLADLDKKIHDYCNNNENEMIKISINSMTESYNKLNDEYNILLEYANDHNSNTQRIAKDIVNTVIIVTAIFFVVVGLIAIYFSTTIAANVSKRIGLLTKFSAEIAEGNFSGDCRNNNKDEIGKLANNFYKVEQTINDILNDMQRCSEDSMAGDLDVRINEDKYKGSYKDVAVLFNQFITDNNNQFLTLIEGIDNYGNGNFDYISPRMPGKKAMAHETMDKVRKNLNGIFDAINIIIENITKGNLDFKLPTDEYQGSWENLIKNMNLLVNRIKRPLDVVDNACAKIAQGDLNVKLNNVYSGEFGKIVDNLQDVVNTLTSYIFEINDVLSRMSKKDLNITVEQDYKGDFKNIKTALELIIDNFNELVSEIVKSSEHITIGANHIAQSSVSLSNGTTKQAATVEEINTAVASVAEQSKQNVELVETVDKRATDAKKNVENGSKEMEKMLDSMKDISEASNNISNVIKVIDDIAFQTNILALNAAVEAARAGVHGKGFAVVADEVRTLANRSAVAVKETTSLIQNSLDKVNEGTALADSTADALKKIVSEVIEISNLASKVSHNEKTQVEAFEEIETAVTQITDVINDNSSSSEESAAAAQELASQAETFNSMVSDFILKN